MDKSLEVRYFHEYKLDQLTSEIESLKEEISARDKVIENYDRLFDIISSTHDVYLKICKSNNSDSADSVIRKVYGR